MNPSVNIWVASGGEGDKLPILPYWPELAFGLVVFLVFLWIIKTKVVPALERAYDERRAAIEGSMEEAAKAKAAAEESKSKYADQLSAANDEANAIREEARSEAAAIVAESRTQATAEAERISAANAKQIEAERAQASVALRNEVGTLSTTLASKIVGESLEDEVRQRGIVDRFLAELEAGDVKPAALGKES